MRNSEKPASFTDIPTKGWIKRYASIRLLPYLRLARLDRPIGTWLLLWPCWWSLAMAGPTWQDVWLFFGFGIGAIAMRGAGCAWNDIADRNYDGQVERTQERPIPSGQLSIGQAVAFMILLALVGFNVLVRFNTFTIYIGLMSLALIVVYPFMKRITWWPQFFLGLAFNWGALLGWAAIHEKLGIAPILLYLGGIAWTLGYDTIYAHQDKIDDALIGIKSSARLLGASTKPVLFMFYLIAICLFGIAGWFANLNSLFALGLGIAALQLYWQVTRININDPSDCLLKFRSNTWFGWLFFLSIMLSHAQ